MDQTQTFNIPPNIRALKAKKIPRRENKSIECNFSGACIIKTLFKRVWSMGGCTDMAWQLTRTVDLIGMSLERIVRLMGKTKGNRVKSNETQSSRNQWIPRKYTPSSQSTLALFYLGDRIWIYQRQWQSPRCAKSVQDAKESRDKETVLNYSYRYRTNCLRMKRIAGRIPD